MRKIIALLFLLLVTGLDMDARMERNNVTKRDFHSSTVVESILGRPAKLKNSYPFQQQKMVALLYNSGSDRRPEEILVLLQTSPKDHLVYKWETAPGETLEKPILFTANNFTFLNISTEPAGSGGFVEDAMLWLAPDGTAHEVSFERASEMFEGLVGEGEVVLNGGEKEFYYQDNQMKFEFWVAREGDPHCCPYKMVEGTYKLQGDPKYDYFTRKWVSDFRILVDELSTKGPDSIGP